MTAGIFKHSMGARNRVAKGLSYRPARLGIDFWAKVYKFGLAAELACDWPVNGKIRSTNAALIILITHYL